MSSKIRYYADVIYLSNPKSSRTKLNIADTKKSSKCYAKIMFYDIINKAD